MTANYHYKITVFLLFIFIVACKKDAGNITINTDVVLTAKGGEIVTITGQNLKASGVPTVKLNNTQLPVESVSSTSLTVLIPKLIGSGQLQLIAGGKNFTGPQFNYLYVATVSTIAGTGENGYRNGDGGGASFNNPFGIVADTNGDLYVCDEYNRLIRKISAATRQVSSISLGELNFFSPYDITLDTINHVLYATDFNAHVMKMNSDGSNQAVIYTTTNPTTNTGVAIGPDGLLYVSNNIAGTIINMHTDGTNVTQYAAGITTPRNIIFDTAGELFVAGYNIATQASAILQVSKKQVTILRQDYNFGGWEIARDAFGNFYEADHFNNRIRLIDPNGNAITLAGSGTATNVDGIGTSASFNGPQGITIDSQGNLYVTTYNYKTSGGNKVRKITVQ